MDPHDGLIVSMVSERVGTRLIAWYTCSFFELVDSVTTESGFWIFYQSTTLTIDDLGII